MKEASKFLKSLQQQTKSLIYRKVIEKKNEQTKPSEYAFYKLNLHKYQSAIRSEILQTLNLLMILLNSLHGVEYCNSQLATH